MLPTYSTERYFFSLMLIVIKILWIKNSLSCTGMCSLISLNVCFLVFLNWSMLTSGAAAVLKKGYAISPVVACIMLTRGKVIQFHIKANVRVSLRHTIFNTVMWNDMVLKSVTFIFIQLKHEKHYLPHLKNKFYSPTPNTHFNMPFVQMVVMSLVA